MKIKIGSITQIKFKRAEESDAYVKAAILSVNKNDVLKSWREESNMMLSPVKQHHMVPFHDRWVQRQIKHKDNIEKNWIVFKLLRGLRGAPKD